VPLSRSNPGLGYLRRMGVSTNGPLREDLNPRGEQLPYLRTSWAPGESWVNGGRSQI
jgi:hypothetical protein